MTSVRKTYLRPNGGAFMKLPVHKDQGHALFAVVAVEAESLSFKPQASQVRMLTPKGLYSTAQGRGAHPGEKRHRPILTPKGFHHVGERRGVPWWKQRCRHWGMIKPLRGWFGSIHPPGCASRPWAVEYNPFGVKTVSKLRERDQAGKSSAPRFAHAPFFQPLQRTSCFFAQGFFRGAVSQVVKHFPRGRAAVLFQNQHDAAEAYLFLVQG